MLLEFSIMVGRRGMYLKVELARHRNQPQVLVGEAALEKTHAVVRLRGV